MPVYQADNVFEKLDFSQKGFEQGEYDHCRFVNCDLHGCNLSMSVFIDCVFQDCHLSNANLSGTVFRDVTFTDCKMLGLRFDAANAHGLDFRFEHCQLSHSSFFRTRIRQTHFSRSVLEAVDFTEADLTQADFSGCDLKEAHFERSILDKADFRTAENFDINPELNRMKKAKFSLLGLAGLLGKYDLVIDSKL